MDRIIEVKVNGNYIAKDNKFAGVQHEANVTFLRIEFDEGWDGYAKKVTWWDANGENPVERTLTADLLEDITASTRIYICPIPGEAMAEAGDCTFVIDGYVDGKRQRSVSDTLIVKEAPFIEEADQPADPTPTQAEQLQVQIDSMLGDMQEQAVIASNAANAAKESEENAKTSEENAATSASEAEKSAENAALSEGNAKTSAEQAAQSIATVEAARNAAEAARIGAEAAATAAEASASEAKQSESNAANSANAAASNAQSASASQSAAASSAQSAAGSAGTASQAATNASASEKNAAASEAAAKAAQKAAEEARDAAGEIAGGDFASKTEAQGYARTAEENANKYTDAMIVQPDWGQNDESAKDYVKNRTHYSEVTTTALATDGQVFENYTVTLVDGMTEDGLPPIMMEYDKTYTVIWDGVEYTCPCNNTDVGIFVLGGAGEYPFEIDMVDGESSNVFAYDTEGNYETGETTHTFSVYEVTETVKQLDPKYLPDGANLFWVHFTSDWDDAYLCAESYDEIVAAYQTGAKLFGLVDGYHIYQCIYADYQDAGEFRFVSFNMYDSSGCDMHLITVSYDYMELVTTVDSVWFYARSVDEHNTDSSAHSDIRQAVSNAASAAAAAQTTADSKEAAGTAASAVSAHNADSTAHADIRTAVNNAVSAANSKAPAVQYGTTEVTTGSASSYPEGTLYVVIE